MSYTSPSYEVSCNHIILIGYFINYKLCILILPAENFGQAYFALSGFQRLLLAVVG